MGLNRSVPEINKQVGQEMDTDKFPRNSKQVLFIELFPSCGFQKRFSTLWTGEQGPGALQLWLELHCPWARLEVTFLLTITELHSSIARVEGGGREGRGQKIRKIQLNRNRKVNSDSPSFQDSQRLTKYSALC